MYSNGKRLIIVMNIEKNVKSIAIPVTGHGGPLG
jgi:hypothetical protein